MTGVLDLSPEQRQVVETWNTSLAVLAGAGSGKTTTLVIKCEELLKANPKGRFAAVSFTERSASDLRAKLSERLSLLGGGGVDEGGVLGGHWVMTIHGLCGAIIREFPREAGYDGDEGMLSETEAQLIWERALDSLWADDLPDIIQKELDILLLTESRDSIFQLVRRVRSLHLFGVAESLAKQDEVSRALEAISGFVMERYDRLKRRTGALDFDDLEKGAERALEFETVRRTYHDRFQLVLVDEFQDTNPIQAKIIRKFCRPNGSNLCVVGDPKQSIYRFRDADLSVFEEFCKKLDKKISLTWNFRSRPGIIQFVNGVCEKVFRESGLEYEALVPKREPAQQDPVVRLDVKSPTDLGNWIAAEVKKGIPLHEMALLLRKIRGNEKWLKSLTASGIPLAVGSGGLFWEDPRVREMVAFLKWWDNPNHTLSGAVFLRAPWVGIKDQDLDHWIREDKTCVGPFFKSGHPVAQALEKYRGKTVRPSELILALLINEEVEFELGAPLLGLWHRLEELSSKGQDFHASVAEVALAMQESRRERDVPPPRNQGQLSVLTLHGSKGLEFPHVILIDLGKRPRASEAPRLFWDRAKGAYLSKKDEDGERDKSSSVELQWRDDEKKKALEESKRIFYVALTRARERLVLVCPELPESASEEALKQDDWRGWVDLCAQDLVRETPPVHKFEVTRPSFSSRIDRSQIPQTEIHWVRPRHSVTEWNLLSRCPRAYEWTYIRPRQGPENLNALNSKEKKLSLDHSDAVTQRELGTRVHACLETRDIEGLRKLEAEVGTERLSSEKLIEWVNTSPLMTAGDDVWTELNFEVCFKEIVLVGSLDRLVLNSGKYTLIDFKVTERQKSPAQLLDSYRAQLTLYSWALGMVDPSIRPGKNLDLTLVNISSEFVQTVRVPVSENQIQTEDWIESLARESDAIVNGVAGKPNPGEQCRSCSYRSLCPESSVTKP